MVWANGWFVGGLGGLNECLQGKPVEAGGGASRKQKPCTAKLNLSGFLSRAPASMLEASNSKEKPGSQDGLKTVGASGLPQQGAGSLPRLIIRDSRELPPPTCFLSLGREKRGVL